MSEASTARIIRDENRDRKFTAHRQRMVTRRRVEAKGYGSGQWEISQFGNACWSFLTPSSVTLVELRPRRFHATAPSVKGSLKICRGAC